MSAKTVACDTLRNIPIFEGLSDQECEEIGRAASVETFSPGEVILKQGKSSQNLWVVLEGTCEVVKQVDTGGNGGEIMLTTLEPYANFGEMSFFHSAPHSAGVRAKSQVKLLRLKREAYDKLINNGVQAAYKLAYNTVESLADRLRRMDDWVAELVRDTAARRKEEWAGFRNKLFDEWHL